MDANTLLVTNYNLCDIQRGFGGLDYCRHELAHYVVLFRRARLNMRKSVTRDMHEVLDWLTEAYPGRSQLHEIRTIALVCAVIGTNVDYAVGLSWTGIEDVGCAMKRSLVTSKSNAVKRVRATYLSPRLITAFKRTIEWFAQEQRGTHRMDPDYVRRML